MVLRGAFGLLFCCFVVCFVVCCPSPLAGLNRRSQCKSQHGFTFNPIRPVQKARSKSLSFCTKYRHNTCCNRTHTDVLMRSDRMTAVAGFNADCRALTEVFLCSVCDARVGTKAVNKACPGLCDRWFAACRGEFYTAGVNEAAPLVPCTENSLVCSGLPEIVSNGRQFCERMGYKVAGDPAAADAAAAAAAAAADSSSGDTAALDYMTKTMVGGGGGGGGGALLSSDEGAIDEPCFDGSVSRDKGKPEAEDPAWQAQQHARSSRRGTGQGYGYDKDWQRGWRGWWHQLGRALGERGRMFATVATILVIPLALLAVSMWCEDRRYEAQRTALQFPGGEGHRLGGGAEGDGGHEGDDGSDFGGDGDGDLPMPGEVAPPAKLQQLDDDDDDDWAADAPANEAAAPAAPPGAASAPASSD